MKRHGLLECPAPDRSGLEPGQPITEVVNGTFRRKPQVCRLLGQKFPDREQADHKRLPSVFIGGLPLTMIKIVLIATISFASPSQ
jgi:hypothetical protein